MRGRLKGRSPLSKGVGFLEEFSKDEVKSRVDIVALFASFGVKLEKKGSSWMGSCPFHEDKSPSLSVDQSKGLYHCFGCGESGDVFNLVMRFQTLSFPEALDFLKDFASSACRGPGPKSSPDLQNRPSLKDVIAAYRRDLETSREAGSYLKSRGLYHPGILGRQEVGFASGALEGRISKDQRAALEEMGILNARGKEHFLGCITIPLRSLQGEPVGLYGRSIEKRGSLEHLYMRGPHQGLLNPKAYGVYPERMILTESILDALSLMVLGFQNLDALYGAKGLTETHIEALKRAGTREVILALDNDEAGRRGALTIAERLRREGIRSRRIFPPLKDWNEYLRGSGPSEDKKAHIERLIRDATLMAAAPLGLTFSGKRGSCKATSNEISYKIIRMNEGASFKVNIRASLVKLPKASPPDEAASDENTELQPDGRRIIDNVDLFSARSRSLFANQLARLSETLEPARIERELVCILEYLEANEEDEGRDNRLSFPLTPGPRERVEGLALLRDPALFKRIEEDLEELGYVGEGVNKRLMYIAASSRKMESPISIIVHSQSASGKSYLIDTVRRLMPPEDALNLTSLSDQALNYMEDDALVGKFLTLGESVHSESVEYQLREMLSSGELSRLVTTKDEKSGRMVSHMVKKKVRVAMVMSTTMSRINEENASRSFLISADESQSQTEAIHRRQREKYSLRAYRKREEAVPAIIERHQAAQRLIKPRMIVNPFAGLLSFPSSQMRTRRDHERFIDLIAAVCFLRQFQKETKTPPGSSDTGSGAYIECDIEDYRIAHEIMSTILPSTLGELPASAERVLDEVRSLIESRSLRLDIAPDEIWVTQRELRESSGLGHELVKKNLRLLAEWEYVKVRASSRGASKRYGLGLSLEPTLISLLPAASEIESRMEGVEEGGELEKWVRVENELSVGVTSNNEKVGPSGSKNEQVK